MNAKWLCDTDEEVPIMSPFIVDRFSTRTTLYDLEAKIAFIVLMKAPEKSHSLLDYSLDLYRIDSI